jgi:hypothetical protein
MEDPRHKNVVTKVTWRPGFVLSLAKKKVSMAVRKSSFVSDTSWQE